MGSELISKCQLQSCRFNIYKYIYIYLPITPAFKINISMGMFPTVSIYRLRNVSMFSKSDKSNWIKNTFDSSELPLLITSSPQHLEYFTSRYSQFPVLITTIHYFTPPRWPHERFRSNATHSFVNYGITPHNLAIANSNPCSYFS